MRDESGSPARFVLSFAAAGVVLVLLVLLVSRASDAPRDETSRAHQAIDGTAAQLSSIPPPLPTPEVTIYYLVDTEAEATTLRMKADEDDADRRAAGQPAGARSVVLVAESPDAEVVYRAELTSMAQRSLQAGYGVRYDIVDLRAGH